MKTIDYNDFKLVFETSESMPKTKEDLMIKLYAFYVSGARNESERIAGKLRQLID